MIEIKNVTFSYDGVKKGLHNINLTIQDGECVLLCGKSGCGKTTITKLINGLIPHFCEEGVLDGTVFVDGIHVAESEVYQLSEHVGSVFQNPKSQFFHIESNAELTFGLENYGVQKEKMLTAIEKTICELHIEKLLNRNVFQMSGGEKQTLAFAAVNTLNPNVYVLDEPTANLDEEGILLLKKQIETVKKQGKTVVIAEHRLWFLKDLIDRAIYIEDGSIVREYSREEFLSLTEDERISMGLRKIENTEIHPVTVGGSCDFSADNISVSYKDKSVLENVCLYANEGEILGIVGRNGIGKTTLLRTLCGLNKKSGGTVALHGKELSLKEQIKNSYLIMQDVNSQLFTDSVMAECKLCGTENENEMNQLLADFDLLEFQEQHPMALSGGQKQRLAIITGILSSKKVIFFDEPTSGLDYQQMKVTAQALKILAKKGVVVIVATHDKEFLELATNHIIELR